MTILILTGGRSQRMGRDKATLERPGGTRQIDHLISLAREFSPRVIVSTNDPSLSLPDGIEAMPDLDPGTGPLGALATYAEKHGGPVLVLGCDLYLLDADTLRHLFGSHDSSRTATCFANRIDGRPEPLCAIYEVSGISRAAAALARGERCARHFLESLDPQVLELPHPAALDNANTPEELAECFAKLEHGVTPKRVKVLYFAKLREARGTDEETVDTLACTPAGLYEELRFRHRLPLDLAALRAARNGDFCAWTDALAEGDEVVFIPPVAGG